MNASGGRLLMAVAACVTLRRMGAPKTVGKAIGAVSTSPDDRLLLAPNSEEPIFL